jgi:hypothetical protein
MSNRHVFKKPHLRRELEAWMHTKGVRSFTELANSLNDAGYRADQGGFYRTKLSNYLNRNAGVPDDFFLALDRVYGLTDEEGLRLFRAKLADGLRRPITG